jgi:hypothetical protein
MISLVVRTWGQETIVLGIYYAALVADSVVRVLSYDYPFFLL